VQRWLGAPSESTPGWIRTSDLRIRSPLLYPLSYRGMLAGGVADIGMAGFEPTTPASQTRCSTKLSYIPCG
jgi:hypothetical protein